MNAAPVQNGLLGIDNELKAWVYKVEVAVRDQDLPYKTKDTVST